MAVDRDAVVLVALRVAAGEGEGGVFDGERTEEGEQVVGVEAGGVESHVEVNATMAAHEIDESLPQLGIADGRLDDFEVRGGGLQVGIEEGGIVSVA